MTDRATIEDVARGAGVSVATVSRALRGLPNVAPATRARVADIARGLEYQADPAGSRLASGRTRTLGIVVPNLSGWYCSQVVGGAEAICSETGYDLLVSGLSGMEAQTRFLQSAATLHRRVDGLILVDLPAATEEAALLATGDLSIASIGFTCEGVASVMLDDVGVGLAATAHLLDLGHRDIGLIEAHPDDPNRVTTPARRRAGFERALTDAGLRARPDLLVSGDFSVQGGHDAMTMLLGLPSPPTAVFAMSDEMAMGAMKAARDLGVSIPGELSIIGVDDHDLAHVLDLTTIRQDPAGHGAAAARWVVDDLDGANRGISCHQPTTELVVRGTTAPMTHG